MAKNELALIEKKVHPLVAQAVAYKVTDDKSMKGAVVLLSNMNKAGDSIKESKEKLTKPLNAALKEIRSRYKPLEDPFEEAIGKLRKTMTAYQTAQVAKADGKKEKIADRVARGTLKAETAITKIEGVEEPDKEVSTEEGLVQFRTVKQFEVTDFAAMPDLYKAVDERAIREAMKNDTPIKGVRYYTEQVPANYR